MGRSGKKNPRLAEDFLIWADEQSITKIILNTYKFVTEYIIGKISYDEMFRGLEIAIHQFAKRQMTWFRGMERRGFNIHWIDALLPMEEKIEKILALWQ